MTEKERREDEALKNCIQEAYGLSDEQLLAELEELEASLSEDEFVGAEDRIYARIMQREAEKEESSVSDEEAAASAEIPAPNPTPIRKISKKKKWLVVGIAAALVVGAGVSTIGGYNSSLRRDGNKEGVVLDGGQNIVKTGGIEDAYKKIEETLGIPVLKLNYLPDTWVYEQLKIENDYAIIVFLNGDDNVYFILEQESKERSLGVASDRLETGSVVHNNWLSMDIHIDGNKLENNVVEYSATIYREKASYRIIGKMSESELSEVLKELSY